MDREREYKATMLEGGEGCNPYEYKCDPQKAHAAHVARLVACGFADAATTQARRAAWNARVKSGEFGATSYDAHKVHAAEIAQGWTINDLKAAVKHYAL